MTSIAKRSAPRPRILHTKAFTRLFWSLVGQEPKSLVLISPFLGKLPSFTNIVDFSRYYLRSGQTSLTIVTRKPRRAARANPDEAGKDREHVMLLQEVEADALEILGVRLLVRPKPLLHSKVYQLVMSDGRRYSFVGSANFTKGGFVRNDETVAFFMASEDNEAVSREVERLVGGGSIAYGDWKILRHRSKNR